MRSFLIILSLIFNHFADARDAQKFALTVSYQTETGDDVLRQPTFLKATNFYSDNGYDSVVLANSSTRDQAKPPAPTIGEFRKAASALIKKAQKGDQVFLNLLTHGSREEIDGRQHSFKLADGDLSLSEIKKLVQTLEGKGATIALLDQSCYSGATMDLATDNICVMGVSSRNDEGYVYSNDEVWKTATSGMSLEDVYLKARKNDLSSHAFPFISTAQGRHAARQLASFTRFAENARENVDSTTNPQLVCVEDTLIASPLLGIAGSMGDILAKFKLHKSLEHLNELTKNLPLITRNLHEPGRALKFMQAITSIDSENVSIEGQSINLMDLAGNDYAKLIESEKSQLAKSSSRSDENEKRISFLEKADALQKQLARQRPEFAKAMEFLNNTVVDKIKQTKEIHYDAWHRWKSSMIAAEREAYHDLYTSSPNDLPSNKACQTLTF